MAFWTCGSNPICRASWRGIRRATTLGLCVDVPSPSFAFPVRRAAAAPKPRPRVFPSSRRRGVRANGFGSCLGRPGPPCSVRSLSGFSSSRLLSQGSLSCVFGHRPRRDPRTNVFVCSPSEPRVTVCLCIFRPTVAFSSTHLLSQGYRVLFVSHYYGLLVFSPSEPRIPGGSYVSH